MSNFTGSLHSEGFFDPARTYMTSDKRNPNMATYWGFLLSSQE
ncbi:hypothetical protein VCHA49P381_40001 [Vibrio chagasii]|nr:hypothetical protein VCHA49P381_40001 [Vibrio chagasii]